MRSRRQAVTAIRKRDGFVDTSVKCNVTVAIPDNVLLNVDVNSPGLKVGLTPRYRNSIWLMRVIAMWEYRTINREPARPTLLYYPPDFSFVVLDIEVSIYTRSGSFPPLDDDMIPICTTNVEWYESTEKDVCFCIYKLGKHTTFEYRAREDTFREQGENSLEACRTAYKILKRLLPEFLNILNGFVLNLKRIATHIVRNLGANVREEAIGQQQIRDALELTQWDRDHWDFGVEDEDDEEWPFGVMKFSRLGQMINPTGKVMSQQSTVIDNVKRGASNLIVRKAKSTSVPKFILRDFFYSIYPNVALKAPLGF
ncbi:uncharacterized protein FFUJ_07223 [Fusarium fujikuroi IMI 58289]|uniref:Uncharacterized protein n=1 Tax=Gibberella fujikuroi (strain CBS 195.34 / IMI 58289 / NRRL A-6831) TaxID=1279085 RepID=S0E438_GIBF5|nr:uncharacterized protein FFUJ_07223 [Fusarium fujikuroi IMI 58289]CCT68442.1 uncharacterized protein FFUJ_07223 [Fusarium fujikuroi IMI 58289]